MSKVTKVKAENLKEQPKIEMYEDMFAIVPIGNGQFAIGVGNSIVVRQTFTTPEEAKKYIDNKPWELIINTTCMVYDLSKTVKNDKES